MQRGGFDSHTAHHIIKYNIRMDKPINSRSISAQSRVYYIDSHSDKKGQQYIIISEIPKNKAPGNKKRQRIFIHAENLDKFIEAFKEVSETIKPKS